MKNLKNLGNEIVRQTFINIQFLEIMLFSVLKIIYI